MDIIKLDDLKAYRDNRIASGNADFDEMDRLSAFIANVETIEPKRGEWIKITKVAMVHQFMCSQCGRIVEDVEGGALIALRYPFCHCGADMRKESE